MADTRARWQLLARFRSVVGAQSPLSLANGRVGWKPCDQLLVGNVRVRERPARVVNVPQQPVARAHEVHDLVSAAPRY